MIKVLIQTKGKTLAEKVMAVTKKCVDLHESFDSFGWEFARHGDELYFTAWYRDGEEENGFSFPLHNMMVGKEYTEIQRERDELKWSALFYEREEKE